MLSKKKVYEVNQELGGGEFFPSACPGAGNRPPEKEKKMQIHGGMPGGHGNRSNCTMHCAVYFNQNATNTTCLVNIIAV